MQEVFEKIKRRLLSESTGGVMCPPFVLLDRAIEIVNQVADEYNNSYVPCVPRNEDMTDERVKEVKKLYSDYLDKLEEKLKKIQEDGNV